MWYGDDGQWIDYSANTDVANEHVVERPILENPLPEADVSGGPITIVNPATNQETLSYTLDGTAYTIPPAAVSNGTGKTCEILRSPTFANESVSSFKSRFISVQASRRSRAAS